MKKLLFFILALLMTFSLAACTENATTTTSTPTTSSVDTSQTEESLPLSQGDLLESISSALKNLFN